MGGPVAPKLQQTELTLEDIKNFIPMDIVKNLLKINFCGNLGDPGMAPDLLPILEHFQYNNETNIAQQVRTNGGMRTPEFWGEVGKFFSAIQKSNKNHGSVVFSVDGLEDTNHIYRRGVRWDKVIANMEAYSNTGAFGIWEFLLFKHNEHQVDEARKLAEKLGFHLALKNPMGFGEYQGKQQPMPVFSKTGKYEYSIYPTNFQGEVSTFSENYKIDFSFLDKEIPQLTEFSKNLANTTEIKCKAIEQKDSQEIYISATGHLLPCCFLGGILGEINTTYSRWQFNEKINQIGLERFNLRKHTLQEILDSFYFNNLFLKGWEKKPVEEGRLLYCAETCGSISAIDKLYLTRSFPENNFVTLTKKPR
jgi:MoaA/NifB/PqqE/SkfB family radical SAM enzyme